MAQNPLDTSEGEMATLQAFVEETWGGVGSDTTTETWNIIAWLNSGTDAL
jgi:hypothetical protein